MPEAGAVQRLSLPMTDRGDTAGVQAPAVIGEQPPSSGIPAEVSETKSRPNLK